MPRLMNHIIAGVQVLYLGCICVGEIGCYNNFFFSLHSTAVPNQFGVQPFYLVSSYIIARRILVWPEQVSVFYAAKHHFWCGLETGHSLHEPPGKPPRVARI